MNSDTLDIIIFVACCLVALLVFAMGIAWRIPFSQETKYRTLEDTLSPDEMRKLKDQLGETPLFEEGKCTDFLADPGFSGAMFYDKELAKKVTEEGNRVIGISSRLLEESKKDNGLNTPEFGGSGKATVIASRDQLAEIGIDEDLTGATVNAFDVSKYTGMYPPCTKVLVPKDQRGEPYLYLRDIDIDVETEYLIPTRWLQFEKKGESS